MRKKAHSSKGLPGKFLKNSEQHVEFWILENWTLGFSSPEFPWSKTVSLLAWSP